MAGQTNVTISITSPVTASACVPMYSTSNMSVFIMNLTAGSDVPQASVVTTNGVVVEIGIPVASRYRVSTIAGITLTTNPITIPIVVKTSFNPRGQTFQDTNTQVKSRELLGALANSEIVVNYIKAGQKIDSLSTSDRKVFSDSIISQIQSGGDVRSLLKVLNGSYSARYPRLPAARSANGRSFLTSL